MIQYREIVGKFNINKTIIAKIFPIIALLVAIIVQYRSFSGECMILVKALKAVSMVVRTGLLHGMTLQYYCLYSHVYRTYHNGQ